MKIIDADAHVIESEATWHHLDRAFHARRPVPERWPRARYQSGKITRKPAPERVKKLRA